MLKKLTFCQKVLETANLISYCFCNHTGALSIPMLLTYPSFAYGRLLETKTAS